VRSSLVLFNRDLRIGDHPALSAAAASGAVIPLFVFDDAILRSRFAAANRLAFMLDALRDLAESLAERGAPLVVRRGDPVAEAIAVAQAAGAEEIHVSADWSAYAKKREARLRRAAGEAGIAFEAHPGVTVVEPGALVPSSGGDHFKVFSPYHRAWEAADWRAPAEAPALSSVAGIDRGDLPVLDELTDAQPSPDLIGGGESEGRRRVGKFLEEVSGYDDFHDDLAGDRTSRLSPYLRFGCISPLELALAARERRGGAPFVRQLCWRDFYHQVLAARPSLPRRDYKHRGDRWSRSRKLLEAWKEGRTGYPVVDAGMRQLRAEGWMHNRARLITGSFLTKDLYVDWREGAWHFWDHLLDGDIANNAGNWQWVAGTGHDARPHRVFNPTRQAERFDPDGDYVRRWVPELRAIDGPAVHEPWNLGPLERETLDYPEPIVDHAEAVAAFRARRVD
jgi:deoxyribodipyrimidine photo-lyase